jgi:hypothetical protein
MFVWIKAAVCIAVCSLGLIACDKKPAYNALNLNQPFGGIQESSIVGKYKWIESGMESGTLTLHEDHSVTNWKGEKKPGYRWELQKEGLLLIWNRGFNFFPKVVAPGIYEGQKNSQMFRMEKSLTNP